MVFVDTPSCPCAVLARLTPKGQQRLTAVSISVRQGKDLQQEGKFTLAQILEDIPGVSGGAPSGALGAGSDQAATGIVVRGIASNNASAGTITSTAPATAAYVAVRQRQDIANVSATWTFGRQRSLTAYIRNPDDNRYKLGS